MRLNLEIELDWIDEESNLDETVQNRIIKEIVAKIEQKIISKVETKIESTIDNLIVKKINEKTEAIFEDFINKPVSLTDNWGSNIKCYNKLSDLLKERFDNFMIQNVDENGKIYDGNYSKKYSRITYIIDRQLKEFSEEFTKNAVKKVSEEIKTFVQDGLTTKLGAELMKVLKVEEMLKLSK